VRRAGTHGAQVGDEHRRALDDHKQRELEAKVRRRVGRLSAERAAAPAPWASAHAATTEGPPGTGECAEKSRGEMHRQRWRTEAPVGSAAGTHGVLTESSRGAQGYSRKGVAQHEGLSVAAQQEPRSEIVCPRYVIELPLPRQRTHSTSAVTASGIITSEKSSAQLYLQRSGAQR
jgi:hypothetical protein